MDKDREKKGKKFRLFFRIYTLVLLIAAGTALCLLYGKLKDYQAGADADRNAELIKRAPQLAFEEYLSALTADTLTKSWFENHPESFDDDRRVEEYWETRLQAARAYKDAAYTPETPVFVLADEDGVFARFFVSGEELDRSVEEPVLEEPPLSSCTVETLDGNTVYCNGKQLTQEQIAQSEICYEETDYADKLVNPIRKVTYEIEVLVPEPAFEVQNDSPYDMQTCSDGQVYYTLKDEDGAPLQEYAGKLVQALLDFYLIGAENTRENMAAALSYIEKGSEAYTIVATSYNSVIWREVIRGAKTELSFAPVIVWADNCVSVDVSYHTTRSNTSDETIADGTYRIFFYDFGDGFKVYDLALY